MEPTQQQQEQQDQYCAGEGRVGGPLVLESATRMPSLSLALDTVSESGTNADCGYASDDSFKSTMSSGEEEGQQQQQQQLQHF